MAANPISNTGPAPVGNLGQLSCFVRQPCDTSPSNENGNNIYVEVWKGPYEAAKNLPYYLKPGDSLTKVHSQLGSDKIQCFQPPLCPPNADGENGTWTLDSISIRELEAGLHAEVRIKYYANYGGTSTTLAEVSELETWNVHMVPWTLSPLAFCANEASKKYVAPKNGIVTDAHWEDTVYVPDIQKAAQNNYQHLSCQGGGYVIGFNPIDKKGPMQTTATYYLGAASAAIMQKYSTGKQCLYHLPVVTHTTVKQGLINTSSYDEDIGGDLDTICDLPSDCPYSFADGPWEWLKVGDTMTQTKDRQKGIVYFTRTESFEGYPEGSIDVNFYGTGNFRHDKSGIEEGRWKLGEL